MGRPLQTPQSHSESLTKENPTNIKKKTHKSDELQNSKSVGICRDLSGSVGSCRELSGSVGICRDLSGSVGICRDPPGSVGIRRRVVVSSCRRLRLISHYLRRLVDAVSFAVAVVFVWSSAPFIRRRLPPGGAPFLIFVRAPGWVGFLPRVPSRLIFYFCPLPPSPRDLQGIPRNGPWLGGFPSSPPSPSRDGGALVARCRPSVSGPPG